jgi:hypothetical protein
MCSLVNFKFTKLKTSQFTILKILKLQVHVHKYVKLLNYKVTNYKCTFAYLQVCTCLIFMFSYLHVLQNYTHINFQFAGIAGYKLQN